MAQCILRSMKRFSLPLNPALLPSKCLSHASFAIAAEPKTIPAIHAAAVSNNNNKNVKNKKLLLKKAMDYRNTVECVKLQENAILHAQDLSSGSTSTSGGANPNGCSDEQLALVFESLREHLPMLFVTVMDYSIYHPQLIFENNIQGKRTVGVGAFIVKVSMLRMLGHFKYAYVDMEILKMTKHPEDSTVKIRWRISGITGFQIVSQMWKYKVWRPKEMISKKKVWVDGFSTMYVGSDGKIFKHVADKVMPDQNFEVNEKTRIVSPLAMLFVGLSPDLSSAILG